MSMLSDRRSRRRYNLVPRGKPLYEDGNSFGTKMLEKMGWKKDKGLGAKEDGEMNFIRIRYKHDNEGLGYEKRDDQWTQHENNFNGLLKSLGGQFEPENDSQNASEEDALSSRGFGFKAESINVSEPLAISGESLEAKSKRSKVRVHYMKFTRGKDISRYSQKDLANIFGKKSFCVANHDSIEDSSQAAPGSEITSKVDEPKFGVMTISTGTSISDYFKANMSRIRNRNHLKDPSNEEDENFIPRGLADEKITDALVLPKAKKRKQGYDKQLEDHSIEENENFIPPGSASKEIADSPTQRKTKKIKQGCESDKKLEDPSNGDKIVGDLAQRKSKKKKQGDDGNKQLEDHSTEDSADFIPPGLAIEEIIDIPAQRKAKKRKQGCKDDKQLNQSSDGIFLHIDGATSKKSKKKKYKEENQTAVEIIQANLEKSESPEAEQRPKNSKKSSKKSEISVDGQETETTKLKSKKKQALLDEAVQHADEAKIGKVDSEPGKEKHKSIANCLSEVDHEDETLELNSQEICEDQAEVLPKTDEDELQNSRPVADPEKVILNESSETNSTRKSNKFKKKRKTFQAADEDITSDEKITQESIQLQAAEVLKGNFKSKRKLKELNATTDVEFIVKKAKKLAAESEEEARTKQVRDSKPEPLESIEENSGIAKSMPLSTVPENQLQFPVLNIRKKKKKLNKTLASDAKEVQPLSSDIFNSDLTAVSNLETIEEQVIELSAYQAEKFYNIDTDAFPGSNFSHIIGYGHVANMKIVVIEKPNDVARIQRMYSENFNKYDDVNEAPKKTFKESHRAEIKKMKNKTMFPLAI